VGALLEARAIHPSRSARDHLRWLADSNGIQRARVDEVLDIVGLTEVADRRSGGFSLGMGQRLGIATALLGDPATLLLDEPVNGLDPEGIQWIRQLLRSLADEGRSILVSSHLMSEMAQTADHLLVIGRGRIITAGPIEEIIARSTEEAVRVVTPRAAELSELLADRGADVVAGAPGELEVSGLSNVLVGELAAAHGLPLHELTPISASLEVAYLSLTRDQVDYRSEPMVEEASR
jgi:ABC-2 type transport system ATP-binding protein